jgi:hypothetical protein
VLPTGLTSDSCSSATAPSKGSLPPVAGETCDAALVRPQLSHVLPLTAYLVAECHQLLLGCDAVWTSRGSCSAVSSSRPSSSPNGDLGSAAMSPPPREKLLEHGKQFFFYKLRVMLSRNGVGLAIESPEAVYERATVLLPVVCCVSAFYDCRNWLRSGVGPKSTVRYMYHQYTVLEVLEVVGISG